MLACARAPQAPPAAPSEDVPRVTHGVAAGEVGADSVIVWARTDRAARMQVEVRSDDAQAQLLRQADAVEADDFVAKTRIDGLEPATLYRYRVWFSDGELNRGGELDSASGEFRTAPRPDADAAVRFAWSGDLGGQNVCRDRAEGYPIFRVLERQPLDFFIGLGDMIYADDLCQAYGRFDNAQLEREAGRAAHLATYFEHWRYNRADPAFQRVLARSAYLAVWDDHEVVNDFGPTSDRPSWGGDVLQVRLLPLGLQAFLAWNPLLPSSETPGRLYRTLRFGRRLELFLLDTRQYRDPATRADEPDRPKTMLGREQLTWLKAKLAASDATWKVVASSVPMALPTGADRDRGMDGWANYDTETGYEHELVDIVQHLRDHGIRNNLWLTTDVHFAAVYRHAPLPEDPEFLVYEAIAGPLSAGVFTNPHLDRTLGGERLFYDPEGRERPKTFEQAKSYFNFGSVDVADNGRLTLRITNALGQKLYELTIRPQ